MTSDYQRGASEMREAAAELARRLNNVPRNEVMRLVEQILALPLPADPASVKGADKFAVANAQSISAFEEKIASEALIGEDQTEPPKIITPGNALWAFGLAEEEVKRLRAENAGLRASLAGAMGAVRDAAHTLRNLPVDNPHTQHAWKDAVELEAILAALANPTGVEGMDAPNHIMCIGWETIKRLAAGEAVWIDSIQAGAVAADDLLGVDIDALLAPPSDTASGEGADAREELAERIIREIVEEEKARAARDAENATLRAALEAIAKPRGVIWELGKDMADGWRMHVGKMRDIALAALASPDKPEGGK